METSILAFEVNVGLVRQGLFKKTGMLGKPQPPTMDELDQTLHDVWHPIVSALESGIGASNFSRYFYTVGMEDFKNAGETAVNNSFVYHALSGGLLTDPRVFPFSDIEDRFVASQIRQVLEKQAENSGFEIGVIFLTDCGADKAEEIFKDVYLDFSKKQKGELHLLNFAENGLLSISFANLPDGELYGSLAGQSDARIRTDSLAATNVSNFLTQLDIGPGSSGLSGEVYGVLVGGLPSAQREVQSGYNSGGPATGKLQTKPSEKQKNEMDYIVWHVDRAKFVFEDQDQYSEWKKTKEVFFECDINNADDAGEDVFANPEELDIYQKVSEENGSVIKMTLEDDGPLITAWVKIGVTLVEGADQDALVDWANERAGWFAATIGIDEYDATIVTDDGGDWRLLSDN